MWLNLAITASQPDSRALDYQFLDSEELVLVATPEWIAQNLTAASVLGRTAIEQAAHCLR